MILLGLSRLAVLIVAGVTLALAACASQPTSREEPNTSSPIFEPRRQWNAALWARDSMALAALVEDSAVHVSPQFAHNGREAFLAQFLQAMTRRPAFHLVYAPERITPCERPNCVITTEFGTWSETWL